MNKSNTLSKIIGTLFILPLLCYGIGDSLTSPILSDGQIIENSLAVNIGGLLMILNSIIVSVLGILIYKKLVTYNKVSTLVYLFFRFAEAILLIVGIIAVLSLGSMNEAIPIADQLIQLFIAFALNINHLSYQVAMLFLGVGSLPFCYLMYKHKLIPRFLSLWGFLGYGLLAVGSLLELFGLNYGVQFAIPGGLFELTFGLWLILVGFKIAD